jgi:hypothetical protein
MRRAPHEGQNPRPLQKNATSFSCAQTHEAVGKDAAFEKGIEPKASASTASRRK